MGPPRGASKRDGAAPRRRTALGRLGAAVLGAVVARHALEATCFSPGSKPDGPVQLLRSQTELTPTAEAWTQAARSVASGAPETPFYLEAAWRGTENWWLRPPAYLWAMGIGLAARLWRLSVVDVNQPAGSELEATSSVEGLKKEDVNTALQALKKIELPFYATSAKWQDLPAPGIAIQGNFLRGSLEDSQATMATVRRELKEALGPTVFVHLLRSEEDRSSPKPKAGEEKYELLVSRVLRDDDLWALPLAGGSLALAAYATTALGTAAWANALGPVLQKDAALPLATLCGLLAVGELASRAAARASGVRLAAPFVVPSPQLGVLGVLSSPLTPAPSRAAGLVNALAGPLAMAAVSVLLLVAGLGGSGGDLVALHPPLTVAWPLALLPSECDPMLWAGAHGLLMASLALLPHSPNGTAALQCLVGRRAAEEASKLSGYVYPLLGLLALACYGPAGFGWMQLPFWWSLVLINFGPLQFPPALEEKSEVPMALSAVAYLSIALSCLCVYPWPVVDLLG
mmetsp:Transcript_2552/g.5155  ORF Transcript_2552/g.5155 Transcript_2552/m.5155 type:complete len:516 (-) Transcript_2552:47-1594(-)